MTAYHGGKQRIGKEIAQVIYETSLYIEDDEDFEIQGYCEPFCGMLGVYQHIPSLFKDHKPKLKYKAGDINKSVILMWKAAQRGWKPPNKCTEERYENLRYDGKDSAEKGFIGHQCSFGGVYFSSFASNYGKNIDQKNASDKVQRIAKEVKHTKFSYGDYKQFSNLKGYVIYCDPPYSKTVRRYKETFDNNNFWQWCETMAENNIVFVSEYKAPKGVKKIWSKYIRSGGYKGKSNSGSENLFVI